MVKNSVSVFSRNQKAMGQLYIDLGQADDLTKASTEWSVWGSNLSFSVTAVYGYMCQVSIGGNSVM